MHDELNNEGKPSKLPKSWSDIGAAFARADREHRELQRLKATGKPFAALDFHPERLAAEPEGG